MAIFSKTPSFKDITTHLTNSNIPSIDTNTQLLGMPIPLSDSLSEQELSMLTWIDVYRLQYNKKNDIRPFVFFSYDNVISKPALSDAKSLLKQKKETDLLLYSLGLGSLTQNEHLSFVPEFSSRV